MGQKSTKPSSFSNTKSKHEREQEHDFPTNKSKKHYASLPVTKFEHKNAREAIINEKDYHSVIYHTGM